MQALLLCTSTQLLCLRILSAKQHCTHCLNRFKLLALVLLIAGYMFAEHV